MVFDGTKVVLVPPPGKNLTSGGNQLGSKGSQLGDPHPHPLTPMWCGDADAPAAGPGGAWGCRRPAGMDYCSCSGLDPAVATGKQANRTSLRDRFTFFPTTVLQ